MKTVCECGKKCKDYKQRFAYSLLRIPAHTKKDCVGKYRTMLLSFKLYWLCR